MDATAGVDNRAVYAKLSTSSSSSFDHRPAGYLPRSSLSRNAQHGVDEDLALDSRDVALNSQDEQLASDATDCVIRCFQRVSFGAVLIIITLLLMRSTSQTLQETPEPEKRFVMPEPLIERPQSDHDQSERHGIIDQEFERSGRAIDQDDFEQHGLIDQAPANRRKQGSVLPPGRLPGKCYYSYTGQGLMPANSCFCKLANNEGCRSKSCNCPQGCGSHVVSRQGESSTFRNMKGATGCTSQPADALLTVPESFFRDIRYLSTWCSKSAGLHDAGGIQFLSCESGHRTRSAMRSRC